MSSLTTFGSTGMVKAIARKYRKAENIGQLMYCIAVTVGRCRWRRYRFGWGNARRDGAA